MTSLSGLMRCEACRAEVYYGSDYVTHLTMVHHVKKGHARYLARAKNRHEREANKKIIEIVIDSDSEEEDDLKIVQELCGDTTDLRILRLVSLIATDKDALTSFLNNSCKLYDENLGEDRISTGSLEKILQSVAFLTPKEAKEMTDLIGEDQVVTKLDLEDYLAVKKPNFSKV